MSTSFFLSLLCVPAIVAGHSMTRSALAIGPYTAALAPGGTSLVLAGGTLAGSTAIPLLHPASTLRSGRLSPNGRLTVLVHENDGEQVVVLAPEAGKLLGAVRAAKAAISADGRFAVWARHPSSRATASAEYYAANIDELPAPASSGTAGLPGLRLYPEPSSGLHVLASTIERVDDATFAFLDFSQQARATRVVVVKLSDTEPPVVVAKPLNATDFAELAGASSASPGKPAISRADGEGLHLRVDFAPVSADAQGRTARIRM